MNTAPYTFWLTGLSAAGKTTLAEALAAALRERGTACEILDGDVIRKQLSADLGFSQADRSENIRRVAALCQQINQAGKVAIAALISPYAADRALARQTVGEANFIEIYLATSLAVCEARDPKGLYQRARAGTLSHFTGISDPYEAPEAPALRLDTGSVSVAKSVEAVLALIDRE